MRLCLMKHHQRRHKRPPLLQDYIYLYETGSKQLSIVWLFNNEPNPTKCVHSLNTFNKQMFLRLYWTRHNHYKIKKVLILNGIHKFVYQKSLMNNIKEKQRKMSHHSSTRQCQLNVKRLNIGMRKNIELVSLSVFI